MAAAITLLDATGDTDDLAEYVFTVSPASAGYLVFGCIGQAGDLDTASTDAGTPTELSSSTDNYHKCHIFGIDISSAGDVEITFTMNGTENWLLFGAALITGADTSSPYATDDASISDFPTGDNPVTLPLAPNTPNDGVAFAMGGGSFGGDPTSIQFNNLTNASGTVLIFEQKFNVGYGTVSAATPGDHDCVIDQTSGSVAYAPCSAIVVFGPAAAGNAVGDGLTSGSKLNRTRLAA